MNSKLESDVRCRLQVTPSGVSYGGNRRPGSKYNGSLLPGLWRDSLHVTCGLTACTPGSAAGPTLGKEYEKTLPFLSCNLSVFCIAYNRPIIQSGPKTGPQTHDHNSVKS